MYSSPYMLVQKLETHQVYMEFCCFKDHDVYIITMYTSIWCLQYKPAWVEACYVNEHDQNTQYKIKLHCITYIY